MDKPELMTASPNLYQGKDNEAGTPHPGFVLSTQR